MLPCLPPVIFFRDICLALPRSLHIIFFLAIMFWRTLLGKSQGIPRRLAPMLSINRFMCKIFICLA